MVTRSAVGTTHSGSRGSCEPLLDRDLFWVGLDRDVITGGESLQEPQAACVDDPIKGAPTVHRELEAQRRPEFVEFQGSVEPGLLGLRSTADAVALPVPDEQGKPKNLPTAPCMGTMAVRRTWPRIDSFCRCTLF